MQFELGKKKHAEDMKIKALVHNEKMKEVFESSALQEERKKEEYYKRQKEADERKREIE